MSNRPANRQPRKIQEPAQSKPVSRPSTAPAPSSVSPPQSLGKLSISDAIGLITIRLSKLEEFMFQMNGRENLTDISTLSRSLAVRVNSLEDILNKKIEEPDRSVSEHEIETSSWDSERDQVMSELSSFRSDLDDVRKLVIKLQSSLA